MYKKLLLWSAILNYVVFATGCFVLAGWMFNIEFFKRPFQNTVAMNPLTAILFILLSVSNSLTSKKIPVKQFAGNALAIIVILAGTVKLAGLIFGINPHLDRMLFGSGLNTEVLEQQANRIATNTVFNFMLSGVSLLWLRGRIQKRIILAHFICIIIALIGLLSLISYGYEIEKFYGILIYVPMAVHTAACFCLIALSIFFRYPDKGLLRQFTSPYGGGSVARRFILPAILVPVALGFLRIYSTKHGLVDSEFGTAMLIIFIILVFLVFIFYNARSLNIKDRARITAEAALLQNKSLLQEVVDNTSSFIYIKDLEGKYILVNNSYQQISGIRKEDMIGKTAFDLLGHETAAKLKEQDDQIINENKKLESEEKLPIRGNLIDFFGVRFPLINEEGNVYATGGVFTDITQIKKQGKRELEMEIVKQNLYHQRQNTEIAIQSQEKERRHIGKELHDNIIQLMASSMMMLDTARNNPAIRDECINKSHEVVKQAMGEIRKLSHSLVAPTFNNGSFKDAIMEIAANINLSGIVVMDVCIEENTTLRLLDEKIKLTFYRIIQEQINNILKYSKAGHVLIDLKRFSNKFRLTITDNGIGFEQDVISRGIGLRNIESRCELLSGNMKVVSSPGNGCTLTVEIPA